MENFSELITKRRSTRQFTDQLLTPEEVSTIMKAALMAPSSKNSRPWYFVLVENKDMLKKLSQCKHSNSSFIADAALAVVVVTDPLLSDVYNEDSAIAATYIQLQAEDLGLGSCWVQVSGRATEDGENAETYVCDLLDIPYQLNVGCIIAIGHKARFGRAHLEANLLWERLHIDQFRLEEA